MGVGSDLSNVACGSSIHQAYHSFVALLALGHLQHLLHLAVHAALHLPAGQDVACYLLLLYTMPTFMVVSEANPCCVDGIVAFSDGMAVHTAHSKLGCCLKLHLLLTPQHEPYHE